MKSSSYSMHFLVIGLALIASSCAEPGRKAETLPPSLEAKIVAQEQKASYVTEISFDKGSTTLTPSAKSKLDETMQRARNAGVIDEIKVIAWADREYPSKAKKTLTKGQQKLAAGRGKAIDSYLKQQTPATVDNYNMSERPNALAKLFSSSDARIKRSLAEAGIATTAHDLRSPENASKAMVMLILKE